MVKKQQKAVTERKPPEPVFIDMLLIKVGSLAPGTPYWCSLGGQMLSGVVLYQSLTSTNVKARLTRPITHDEYIDEFPISTGALVLVRKDDYEKQKNKPVSTGEVRGAPGMEGFPQF